MTTRVKGALDPLKSNAQLREEHAARLDATPVVTRCALCRRVHRGTAASGRSWAAEHRAEHHPEIHAAPRAKLTKEQARARAVERSEWKREKHAREAVT